MKLPTDVLDSPPVHTDEHGAVRVGGTRVTLDAVVHAFDAGATPEEIVDMFDSLRLPDFYAMIAFVLRHREDVDSYLAKREIEAERMRRLVEEQFPTTDLRRKLRERLAQRQQAERRR